MWKILPPPPQLRGSRKGFLAETPAEGRDGWGRRAPALRHGVARTLLPPSLGPVAADDVIQMFRSQCYSFK